MAPLDFEIPPRGKSFTARRGDPSDVGEEHVELVPYAPIHGRSGHTIHAFCLPLDEARELGEELIRLSTAGKP